MTWNIGRYFSSFVVIAGAVYYNISCNECKYLPTFAFSGNKDGKKPQDLWPLYFDHYKTAPAISEEDRKELLDLINNENKKQ